MQHPYLSCEGEFRTVYLAPGRNKEAQLAHAKLAKEMKELLLNDLILVNFIIQETIKYSASIRRSLLINRVFKRCVTLSN